MLLIDDGEGGAIGVRVRLRDRLAARLRADHIDTALARGASPDAGVGSALRAQQLTTTKNRRDLATGLTRLLNAVGSQSPARLSVQLNPAAIRTVARDLKELRDRLLAPGPVTVRGAVLTQLLLTSGSGPLYWRGRPDELTSLVRRAIDALDVRSGQTGANADRMR